MPRRTIRIIVWRATMLAGLFALMLRLGFILASISCEHCRSSRNNSHCAPRHVIYYCVMSSPSVKSIFNKAISVCGQENIPYIGSFKEILYLAHKYWRFRCHDCSSSIRHQIYFHHRVSLYRPSTPFRFTEKIKTNTWCILIKMVASIQGQY